MAINFPIRMEMTLNFDTSNIGSSKTFFESLVKIRYNDVVTYFQDFLAQNGQNNADVSKNGSR